MVTNFDTQTVDSIIESSNESYIDEVRSILHTLHTPRSTTSEAATSDDITAHLGDSLMSITQELSILKQMTAVGEDNKDMQAAIKYLEAGAIMINKIIARNIQRP